jgi:hypothetical protein
VRDHPVAAPPEVLVAIERAAIASEAISGIGESDVLCGCQHAELPSPRSVVCHVGQRVWPD